jgi:hypothetical protein
MVGCSESEDLRRHASSSPHSGAVMLAVNGAAVFTVLRDHHTALHPLLQVRAQYEHLFAESFRPTATHGWDSCAESIDERNATVAAGDGM